MKIQWESLVFLTQHFLVLSTQVCLLEMLYPNQFALLLKNWALIHTAWPVCFVGYDKLQDK